MSIGILGKKLGMSQLFDDKGNAVPVTLIEAGPCRITQLKTTALDGYTAVQIGYGLSKDKHISKPEKGHLLKSGEELLKHLKEYRVEETSSYEIGKQITVKNFSSDLVFFHKFLYRALFKRPLKRAFFSRFFRNFGFSDFSKIRYNSVPNWSYQ